MVAVTGGQTLVGVVLVIIEVVFETRRRCRPPSRNSGLREGVAGMIALGLGRVGYGHIDVVGSTSHACHG